MRRQSRGWVDRILYRLLLLLPCAIVDEKTGIGIGNGIGRMCVFVEEELSAGVFV